MSTENIFDGIDDKVSARKWEFEEGDQLGGEVLAVFEGDGDYGPYAGYVIAPAAGSTENGGSSQAISKDDPVIFYVNDNSAAARDLPPGRAKVGDILVVKYFGKETAKSGREFNNFNIILRPRAAAAGEAANATSADGNADW